MQPRLFAIVLCLLLSVSALPTEAETMHNRLGITQISSIDIPYDAARYQRATELGASWNRFPMYWDRIEAPNGRYIWDAYDELIAHDAEYGLQDLVVLVGIPAHRRSGAGIVRLDEPVFRDGTDDPAPGKAINPSHPWALFVRAAAERYRSRVRVWEIWNEPDFEQFWSAGPLAYARLLKVAYLAIKSVDPGAVVMFGGLLYPTQNNFLAQVLNIYLNDPAAPRNGWYMDAVGVHSYGDAWRSGWLTLFVRQTMIEFGFQRPIWVTETGVAVWDDYPGPTWLARDDTGRGLYASQEQAANFLIQSAAYAWAEGATHIFWHQLYDDCGNQPPGTNFPPHDGELCANGNLCFGEAFGIYRNPVSAVCFAQHPTPDTPRPVADAFRMLADAFDAPISPRGVVDDARPDGIVTIEFLRPTMNEWVVVAWNTRQTPQVLTLPAQGLSARLYNRDGMQTITPNSRSYRLDMPAASMPRQRFLADDQRAQIDIGGAPIILIERIASPSRALATNMPVGGTPTLAPMPLATNTPAVQFTTEQIEALRAASPTGVFFVSLNNANLRDMPSTDSSQVIGRMALGDTASVIGRTETNDWLRIEFGGQTAWVAAFLGRAFGDLNSVPVTAPMTDGQSEG